MVECFVLEVLFRSLTLTKRNKNIFSFYYGMSVISFESPFPSLNLNVLEKIHLYM